MNETWIILGATSSMARAFVREVASSGANIFVAGRDMDELGRIAADAVSRGAADAQPVTFDARKPAGFSKIIGLLEKQEGMICAGVFVGSMPEQADVEEDPSLIDGMVADNFTGPAQFLMMLAPIMGARSGGSVVGVGSVAGDRGRLSNYAYGSAKAGFQTFLAGLRNRLGRSGVHVMTVKPGFVDTSMTFGRDGMFLVASPEKIARDIAKGLRKKRNVLYTPFFWQLIMLIIRLVPEAIFKKLSI